MALITPFDPWQNGLCTCPAKYSLSPYTGCAHGCLYCYATSYIRNFFQPRPKKDFLTHLENEAKKIPAGSLVAIANSSDCYQPLEAELKLMPPALEILAQNNLRVAIVTKSALITRDIAILKKISASICITLTTLDEKLARCLEPRASTPQERLQAIKNLSSDVRVSARVDPLIPELNINEIPQLIQAAKTAGVKQIITSNYKAKADNLKRLCASFPQYQKIWEKLYLHRGEKKGGYIYLPQDMRYALITQVKDICAQQGLLFSSCREGFGAMNTATCDGTR